MMSSRLGLVHKDQRGLTLVELMIAIALAGIVTAGITMTFAHLFAGSTRTSNHMTAVRQVQSAGYWVSQDALQAQEAKLAEPSPEYPSGTQFPLTLIWTDVDKTETKVTYTITADGELRRSIKTTPDGGETTETVSFVAQYIDVTADHEGKPKTRLEPGTALTFTVTATVGGQSETRVYQVEPRPD